MSAPISYLCSLGSTLEVVPQRSPYASLDALFYQLRAKQQEYALSAEIKRSKAEKLKKKVELLRNVSENLASVSEPSDLPYPFNEDQITKRKAKLTKLKQQLADSASKIDPRFFQLLSAPNAESIQTENDQTAELLHYKLDKYQTRYQKRAELLNQEIQLYQTQKEALMEKLGKETEVMEFSPGNFDQFSAFSSNLKKAHQQPAFKKYYAILLRYYQVLKADISELKENSLKWSREMLRVSERLNTSSEKLNKSYNQVIIDEASVSLWKSKVETIRNNAHQNQRLLTLLKDFKINQLSEDVEKYHTDLASVTEKLKNELSSVYSASDLLNEINEQITKVSSTKTSLTPVPPDSSALFVCNSKLSSVFGI